MREHAILTQPLWLPVHTFTRIPKARRRQLLGQPTPKVREITDPLVHPALLLFPSGVELALVPLRQGLDVRLGYRHHPWLSRGAALTPLARRHIPWDCLIASKGVSQHTRLEAWAQRAALPDTAPTPDPATTARLIRMTYDSFITAWIMPAGTLVIACPQTGGLAVMGFNTPVSGVTYTGTPSWAHPSPTVQGRVSHALIRREARRANARLRALPLWRFVLLETAVSAAPLFVHLPAQIAHVARRHGVRTIRRLSRRWRRSF